MLTRLTRFNLRLILCFFIKWFIFQEHVSSIWKKCDTCSMMFPDLPTLSMHKQSTHKKKGKSFTISKNCKKICKFCSYQVNYFLHNWIPDIWILFCTGKLWHSGIWILALRIPETFECQTFWILNFKWFGIQMVGLCALSYLLDGPFK